MRIGATHETYAQAEALFDTNVQRVLLVALAAALVAFPFFADQYWLYLACLVAIHIVSTTGLNILTGYTGLVSLGQAAFMAVGAYTVAILEIRVGTPFIVNLIAAGAVTAAAGLVFGIPSLRVKGLYLAIATIAASFILHFLFANGPAILGGTQGLSMPPARLFGFRHPEAMDKLLEHLATASAEYLVRQVEAGADALQIFDSWAGVLDEQAFERFCVRPVARIVSEVRRRFPDIPIVGFPRGAGSLYAGYRERTGVTALGLDWTVPASFARQLQQDGPVQGNLDPLRLVAGGKALEEGIEAILGGLGDGPLVFNLGHGIVPETPIKHVERMLERVRSAVR